MKPPQSDFDGIARPYRFLEYSTLGPILQSCRTYHVNALLHQRSALVLGDGDGRFLARLLALNRQIAADAVDTSRVMLDLLSARCRASAPNASQRLHAHQASAQAFAEALPAKRCYDLVVTHFFLDCLTQPEVETLIETLVPHLYPGALWLVSDFRIPPQGALRPIATVVVRSLYLAFRVLTRLRTTQLPDHATPLQAAGFDRIAQHDSLGGLLTTELWRVGSGQVPLDRAPMDRLPE